MAKTVTEITIIEDREPTATGDDLITRAPDHATHVQRLMAMLGRLAAVRPNKILTRVDSSTDGSTEKPGESQTATVTITHASIGTTDTITIGGVTLTWGTDITIGSDNNTSAANLNTAINAKAELAGIFSSTVATNVVTITATAAPRILRNLNLSTNDATAMALSAAHFGLDTTDINVASSTYSGGL